MKNDNAKIEAQAQQSNQGRKTLKIKTSTQTESAVPELPCALLFW